MKGGESIGRSTFQTCCLFGTWRWMFIILCASVLTGCGTTFSYESYSSGVFVRSGTMFHNFMKKRICGDNVDWEERRIAVQNRGSGAYANRQQVEAYSSIECTIGEH